MVLQIAFSNTFLNSNQCQKSKRDIHLQTKKKCSGQKKSLIITKEFVTNTSIFLIVQSKHRRSVFQKATFIGTITDINNCLTA